jgi:hypothetical protein
VHTHRVSPGRRTFHVQSLCYEQKPQKWLNKDKQYRPALSAVSAPSQANPTVSDAYSARYLLFQAHILYNLLLVGLDTKTELPSWEGFASFAS